MSVKTGPKQKDTRFKPGQSGNPRGRPRGSRNRTTVIAEQLLDTQAAELVQKAVAMALEGDSACLRLCLERLLPPVKDRPLDPDAVKLPKLTAENLAEASAAIVRAVARGALTPSEGQALAAMLEGHRRALELTDLEKRLAALEAAQEKR